MKYKLQQKQSALYPKYPIIQLIAIQDSHDSQESYSKHKAIQLAITQNEETLKELLTDKPKKYFKEEHPAYIEIEQTFKNVIKDFQNYIEYLKKQLKIHKNPRKE